MICFLLLILSSFCIYFGQATKTYELLNYSEFGSEVNGQLYSCDFTEHPPMSDHRAVDPNSIYDIVQKLIDQRRKATRLNYKGDENAVWVSSFYYNHHHHHLYNHISHQSMNICIRYSCSIIYELQNGCPRATSLPLHNIPTNAEGLGRLGYTHARFIVALRLSRLRFHHCWCRRLSTQCTHMLHVPHYSRIYYIYTHMNMRRWWFTLIYIFDVKDGFCICILDL